MSALLEIDLTVPLDHLALRASWQTTHTRLGLFGASGSGKTTLLEAIAGWRAKARGSIRFRGEFWLDSASGVFVAPNLRRIAYVPQDLLLYPHLTVLGNLLAGRHQPASPPVLEKVLDVFDLEPLRDRSVQQLSDGEKRRVALGRALLSAPRLLLLDEPLTGLDAPLRRRVLSYLLRVQGEFAIPTIHVSHDADEMQILAAEVLVLERGQVIARGSSSQVFRPVSTRMNLLIGRVIAMEEGSARLLLERRSSSSSSSPLAPVPADRPRPAAGDGRFEILVPAEGIGPGDEVTVALAAEELLVSRSYPEGISAQNHLPARVDAIEESDNDVTLALTVGTAGPTMAAIVTRRAVHQLALQPGSSVHLLWKASACRVLAALPTTTPTSTSGRDS